MHPRNFARSLARVLGTAALCGLFSLSAAAHDRHSRNISTHNHEPIADCNDLRMEFDGRSAVVQSEDRTITKAEAPVLRAVGETNGGVQVRGWDKDVYSVSLCKAAAPYSDAQKVLSQIKLVFQNGELRVSGPSSEDDWAAYLLIRAPKDASLDLRVTNGPLGIYDVEGKVNARATNGPISLRDCKGELTLNAENGPISMEGSSGKIDVRTQNGPIDVSLRGQTWEGSGLQAHAENGPVTIRVPHGYQSGVVVESDGNGPFSCRSSACSEGRKTWDEDRKRVEFGSGPTLVRVSSVNGPISVD